MRRNATLSAGRLSNGVRPAPTAAEIVAFTNQLEESDTGDLNQVLDAEFDDLETARREAIELAQSRLDADDAHGAELARTNAQGFENAIKALATWSSGTRSRQSSNAASIDAANTSTKRQTGSIGPQAKFENLFGATITSRSDGRYLSQSLTGKIAPGEEPAGLKFLNTAIEGTGSDGGYLVPERLTSALWDDAITASSFLSRARVYPMDGPVTHISGPDWQNRTNGEIAGLLGKWLGEAKEGTEDKTLFRKIALKADKVAIFSQISSELAEDALNIESVIQGNMQLATAYTVDHAMLRGTGVNQPLGVLNSPALITVSPESSQTADTITAKNIFNMVARMDPAFMRRAEWFASPTILPELFRLSFQARTDAGAAIADQAISATPLFQALDNGYYLLGRPLHLVEHMPTKGSLGDLLFADWSRYAVGVRRAATIERNVAPGWMKDAVDFRITMRIAGTPENSAPITPQHGDTFSPFVVLGERA